MKARAHVVHHLPGRVRLRVSGPRRNRAFYDEIKRRLRRVDGVSDVETNAASGSILVRHRGDIASLAMAVLGSDLDELVEIALEAPPVAQRLSSELAGIDRAILNFTHGEMDLGTVASLGLLTMAAVQLATGQQPVVAVSLGWYAAELLRRSAGTEAASRAAR